MLYAVDARVRIVVDCPADEGTPDIEDVLPSLHEHMAGFHMLENDQEEYVKIELVTSPDQLPAGWKDCSPYEISFLNRPTCGEILAAQAQTVATSYQSQGT